MLLRATTNSQRMRLSAAMISSTMPSAKYSCSGSALIFWNGKTAIDGLSGSGKTAGAAVAGLSDPFAGEHLGCELFGKLTGHWSHHSAQLR